MTPFTVVTDNEHICFIVAILAIIVNYHRLFVLSFGVFQGPLHYEGLLKTLRTPPLGEVSWVNAEVVDFFEEASEGTAITTTTSSVAACPVRNIRSI